MAAVSPVSGITAEKSKRQGTAAKPAPDWNNPRKLVLQLDKNDPHFVKMVFNNASNTMKYYGRDNVKVAIVAFGPGVRAFLKESAPFAERTASLLYDEIEIVVCGNTMNAMHKTKADLLPNIPIVKAGVPELIERQLSGWVYVAP
ncbi:MAG: DsrE family protein [Alphaproteobacteria bacterium]